MPNIHRPRWGSRALRSLAGVGSMVAAVLSGCPEPRPPPAIGIARSVPTPSAASGSEPHEPAADPELRANIRAEFRSLWGALRAVDDGDPGAMGRVMAPAGRWIAPGLTEATAVTTSELHRAMQPWSSDLVALSLRQMIDLGDDRFVVQLSARRTDGPARHEMVLLVEPHNGLIDTIRHYGDPLGPVRRVPAPIDPIDPIDPGRGSVIRRGPPNVTHGATIRALVEALERRDEPAAYDRLADRVVLHDVGAGKTRHGSSDYTNAYRADLGTRGHLTMSHHYATREHVVIEGTIRESSPAEPGGKDANELERGFADIHRVADGKVAETWHYLERRPPPPISARAPTGRKDRSAHRR